MAAMVPSQGVPTDHAAYLALKSHYLRVQDYHALAQLSESWAERLIEDEVAAQTYFEAAEVYYQKIGEIDHAISLYRAALAKMPHMLQASARLEEVFRSQQDAVHLLATLEQRAQVFASPEGAHLASPQAHAELHHAIGTLIEQTLQRPEAALQHYQYGAHIDPTYLPNVHASRVLLLALGQVELASTYYEHAVQAETDRHHRAALLIELSRLYADTMGSIEKALQTLDRVTACAPLSLQTLNEAATAALEWGHRSTERSWQHTALRVAADFFVSAAEVSPPSQALQWIEAALDAWPSHLAGLALLERMLLAQEPLRVHARWAAFIAHHTLTNPGSSTQAERIIRIKLAQAYLTNAQIDDAALCLEPLLQLPFAQREDVSEHVFELLAAMGWEDQARQLLQEILERWSLEQRIAWLRIKLTTLPPETLGHTLCAEFMLSADPTDVDAGQALEADYRRTQNMLGLRNLLLARAQLPSMSLLEKKSRLKEAATLASDVLGDVEGSLAVWRQLAVLDPTDEACMAALTFALERAERWDEAVQILERQTHTLGIQDHELDARAKLWLRIGHIHLRERNDRPSATRAMQALVQYPPHSAELTHEVADFLVAVDQPSDAIKLLETRLRATQRDPSSHLSLETMLAHLLYETGADDARAYQLAEQVLDEDPSRVEAIDIMIALDAKHNRQEALVKDLERRAAVVEGAARAATYEKLGDVLSAGGQRAFEATKAWIHGMHAHPDPRSVLDKVEALFPDVEASKRLIAELERWEDEVQETSVLISIYRTVAHIYETKLSDAGGARAAFEKLARLDPSDLLAWRHLADLLRQVAPRTPAESVLLGQALEKLYTFEEDPTEKRNIVIALCRNWIDIGEDLKASQLLRNLIDGHHHLDAELFTLLAEAQTNLEDFAGLAVTLEWLLHCDIPPETRLSTVERLCDLYQHRMGDLIRAASFLRVWTELDPESPEPWRRLVVLFDITHQFQDLVDCLSALIEREKDATTIESLVIQASELEAKALKQPELAWHRLCQAMMHKPAEGYHQALKALAESTGRLNQMAEFYVAAAREAHEANTAIDRLKRAALLFVQDINDPNDGFECWIEILSIEPEQAEALDTLDRLAIEHGLWDRLNEVYLTLIEHSAEFERRRSLRLRHIQLLTSNGLTERAFDAAWSGLENDTLDSAILTELQALAPILGREEDLFIVYNRFVKASKVPHEKLLVTLDAAALAFRLDASVERTALLLAEATALCLVHPDFFSEMEQTVTAWSPRATRAGLSELSVVYRSLGVDTHFGVDDRVTLLRHAANLLEKHLQQHDLAARTRLSAALLSPDEPSITEDWYQHAKDSGLWEHLMAGLQALAEHASRKDRVALLHARHADLVLEHGGPHKEEQAAELYRKAFTISKDRAYRLRYMDTLRLLTSQEAANTLLFELSEDVRGLHTTGEQRAVWEEIANLWEHRLSNSHEALDAWRKVLALEPDSKTAQTHVERLTMAISHRDTHSAMIKIPES